MATERRIFEACSDIAYSFKDPSENKGLPVPDIFMGKYKLFSWPSAKAMGKVLAANELVTIWSLSEYDNFVLLISPIRASKKRLFAWLYQFIHDKSTMQVSTARCYELVMECYGDSFRSAVLDAPYVWHPGYLPRIQELLRLSPPERGAFNPEQEFVPSKELVRCVKDGMALPVDEELLSLLRDLRLLDVPDEERERNVAALITEQVEGMFATIAKRTARTGKNIRITTGSRFTPEICEDLTFRLGLDQYNPASILNLLHTELMDFLSHTRKREWGSISAIKGETQFLVNKDAFVRPDYSKILNDDKWEVA
jgi:hypothetical protein